MEPELFTVALLFCVTSSLVYVQSIRLSAGSGGPKGGGLIDELRLGVSHSHFPGDQKVKGNFPTELLFHEYRFIAASLWFRRNQRPDGTWTVPVVRNFRGRGPIKPGWPSAMGQGQFAFILFHLKPSARNSITYPYV